MTWQSAVEAVDRGDYKQAQQLFTTINHFSAKMAYNASVVCFKIGDMVAADEKLRECTERDSYLAVAYFQRAVIACLQGRLMDGKAMFIKTSQNMRGAACIDYKQLGLPLYLTQQMVKQNLDVVEATIRSHEARKQMNLWELQTLSECVFRPPRTMVANLEKKEFLSAAKVVSSVPDIVMQNTKPVVGKCSSAPVSPSSHRKLSVGLSCQQGPHTPPPSRPPPCLPPTGVEHGRQARQVGVQSGGRCDEASSDRTATSVPSHRPLCSSLRPVTNHKTDGPDITVASAGQGYKIPGVGTASPFKPRNKQQTSGSTAPTCKPAVSAKAGFIEVPAGRLGQSVGDRIDNPLSDTGTHERPSAVKARCKPPPRPPPLRTVVMEHRQ